MDDQEKRLKEEILGDAREKAERVVARAKTDAATALKRAKTLNERRRTKALEQTRAEAEHHAENILSGIWNEQRKMWLVRREEVIQKFLKGLLDELAACPANSPERVASLSTLASEALAAMPSDELLVAVASADRSTVTPEWLAERLPSGRNAHFIVQADPAIGGGMRVASADGRFAYDNTFAGRLARLEEGFRRILADCDREGHVD
ncbi:MAG: V-type ATP synthase subunit E [Victivallales bacterium]|nr:V-type ATP synthase subunit E [Victivallales bacterium]